MEKNFYGVVRMTRPDPKESQPVFEDPVTGSDLPKGRAGSKGVLPGSPRRSTQ